MIFHKILIIIAIFTSQILTGCISRSSTPQPVKQTESSQSISGDTTAVLAKWTASPVPPPTVKAMPPVIPTTTADKIKFEISSPAFKSKSPIPIEYSCDGKDMSPPLAWRGVPDGVKSFTLIVDDPDAPGGTWVHWVLYNIPPNRTDLPELVPSGETVEGIGVQGKSSFEEVKYGGPCPPLGTAMHHYNFTLYALDTRLFLPPGASKAEIQKAMKNHILNQAEIVGTYQREIKKKGS